MKCTEEVCHNEGTNRTFLQIAQYLVDPMCRGVFASSARSLSIQSSFPPLYQAEQSHGSLVRGMLSTKPGQ